MSDYEEFDEEAPLDNGTDYGDDLGQGGSDSEGESTRSTSDMEIKDSPRGRKKKTDRHTMNATMYKLVTFTHTPAWMLHYLIERTVKIMGFKWAVASVEFHEDKDTHIHIGGKTENKVRWTEEQRTELLHEADDPNCMYEPHVDIQSSWDDFAKSEKGLVKYVLKYKSKEIDGREPDGLEWTTRGTTDEAKDYISGLIKKMMATKESKASLVMKLVREGKTSDEISDIYPDYMMLYRGKVEKEISIWEDRQLKKATYPITLPTGDIIAGPATRDEKRASYWFAGPPTIQKSTWIEDTFEGVAIWKKRDTRYPYDGYKGQEFIICDGDGKAPCFEEIEIMTEWCKTKTHVFGSCRGTGSEVYLKKNQRCRFIVFTNTKSKDWDEPAFKARFHRRVYDGHWIKEPLE